MLVSPAEPAKLRAVGTVSSLPEKYGGDFMFFSRGEKVVIQRKEIADLIASVQDGRLNKEVAQMQAADRKMLIVEGDIRWTTDGIMVGKGFGQTWTKKQFHGLLWSVRDRGIWVERTEDTSHTIEILEWIEAWFKRGKHSSLDRRPGPVSVWGHPSNKDYQRHLVMGLPGVGPELADRIVQAFGVPWVWRVSQKDLMQVEGIGKVKAKSIWEALGGEED